MANPSIAPEKSVAKSKRAEPQVFIFRLTEKFPELFTGSSPYPAKLDLPTTDTILWPYIDGVPVGFSDPYNATEADFLPRNIRYVAGANSIFVDEQEKGSEAYKLDQNGKNRLLDNEINKNHLTFTNAEIRVPAHERVRRNYIWCSNQCQNQYARASDNGNRFKQINPRYQLLDFAGEDQKSISLGMLRSKAYELAKTARLEQVMPHAKFLNLTFIHGATGEPKEAEAIKEEYIHYAYTNPQRFIDTFADPKVKVVYQVSELVEKGKITLGGKTLGQAHWAEQGTFIAQLPPDKNPIEFLAEFALTKAGEEFSNNLRAYK